MRPYPKNNMSNGQWIILGKVPEKFTGGKKLIVVSNNQGCRIKNHKGEFICNHIHSEQKLINHFYANISGKDEKKGTAPVPDPCPTCATKKQKVELTPEMVFELYLSIVKEERSQLYEIVRFIPFKVFLENAFVFRQYGNESGIYNHLKTLVKKRKVWFDENYVAEKEKELGNDFRNHVKFYDKLNEKKKLEMWNFFPPDEIPPGGLEIREVELYEGKGVYPTA